LSLRQLLEKGYEIKMKDCILTLLDTYGAMITKVIMTKKKHNVFAKHRDGCASLLKGMCERWDLALTYETQACKLWYLKDDGTKRDVERSTTHYTSKSVAWRMFTGQTILQELSKWVYI